MLEVEQFFPGLGDIPASVSWFLKLLVGGYRAPGSFTKQAPGQTPVMEKCVLSLPSHPPPELKASGKPNLRVSLLSRVAGATESLANCASPYLFTIDVALYSSITLTSIA